MRRNCKTNSSSSMVKASGEVNIGVFSKYDRLKRLKF